MQNTTYINDFFSRMRSIIENISREEIDRMIEILFDAWRDRRQIFTMGNGGSASTATHLAADLNKCTVFEGKPRFKVISLGWVGQSVR